MKTKNHYAKFAAVAAVICLFCLTLNAYGQKRRTTRKTTKPAATTPAATDAATANVEIKAAADRVAIQVKNLTKFIFVLGGVAKDLEAIDAEIKTGKITRAATIEQNTKNKQAVVTTIRNLRAGLIALETDFRAKPALRAYVLHVGGIADSAASAEDLAVAGKFTDSGKTLESIVGKLVDALVAMP